MKKQILVGISLAALLLAGCSQSSPEASSAQSQSGDTSKLHVMAGFYPLAYLSEEIGGDHVEVTDLTPPGGEAHDVELSPAQVSAIGQADLGIYLSGGMQPAVEQAYRSQGIATVDAHQAIPADELVTGDPHVWLDPTLLADIGNEVAQSLETLDPEHAQDYQHNNQELQRKLEALNDEYAAALGECQHQTIVTAHEAFGYLARRYGLEQVGVTGINPDAEPSPKRLRDVEKIINDSGATTLYFESATAPGAIRDLADTLGVNGKELNPLESAPLDGLDYLQTMQNNLDALREGLACKQ